MMGSRPRGCDYCLQPASNQDGDTLHVIPLSRTPNGDKLEAEICSTCLGQIAVYVIRLGQAPKVDATPSHTYYARG